MATSADLRQVWALFCFCAESPVSPIALLSNVTDQQPDLYLQLYLMENFKHAFDIER